MPVIKLDMLIAYVNSLDKLHGIATKIFNKIVKGDLKNHKIWAYILRLTSRCISIAM